MENSGVSRVRLILCVCGSTKQVHGLEMALLDKFGLSGTGVCSARGA